MDNHRKGHRNSVQFHGGAQEKKKYGGKKRVQTSAWAWAASASFTSCDSVRAHFHQVEMDEAPVATLAFYSEL